MRLTLQAPLALLVLATASHGQCELSQADGYDNPLTSQFGTSIGVDGDLAAIGDWFFEDDGTGTGFVYVYRRSGVQWLREATLVEPFGTDPEGFSTMFGERVDVSGDRVIVSAAGYDGAGSEAGRAHVFRGGASGWYHEGTLLAPSPVDHDGFGAYVALDGELALVAGDGPSSPAPQLFRFENGAWGSIGSLSTPGAQLRGDVALEGQRALASGFDMWGTPSVFVFRDQAGGWTFEAQLPGTGLASYDGYGSTVALADPYALVGAQGADGAQANQGAAYVWVRDGQSWALDEILWASDGSLFDGLGTSVSLEAGTALVGAWFDQDVGVGQGSAYVFRRDATGWTETEKLEASIAEIDQRFGWSVALSDGVGWVGAPSWNSGRAFAYAVSGPDCNANGALDACDIVAGSSHDFDGEGTPDECQPLSVDGAAVSLGTGGTQTFTLAAGVQYAGEPYLLLGSATGTGPGLVLGSHVLPLVVDAYFITTLVAPNQPPLSNSFALLDGSGGATACFTLPPGLSPALAGTTLFHAYASLSAGVLGLTSNAMPLVLLP